jgi:predicted GTPase
LILNINKPAVRVGYEAKEVAHPGLTEVLDEFAQKNESRRATPALAR